MADKHPYISSGGALVQLLDQLRKSFPSVLSSEVLKKLSIAPGNESYALNIVRFLGLTDDKGTRTPEANKVFTLHEESEFQKAFSDIVRAAYGDLFSLQGDDAWTLKPERLIPFFRQSDQSTELVGTRQASTFRTLSIYAGKLQTDVTKPARTPKSSAKKAAKSQRQPKRAEENDDTPRTAENSRPVGAVQRGDGERVGLTVRIEVNLPASGDQETYDRIFRSIRENLLNA